MTPLEPPGARKNAEKTTSYLKQPPSATRLFPKQPPVSYRLFRKQPTPARPSGVHAPGAAHAEELFL